MNIQEYISSGIIESCVLGLASNEERLEFEQLCAAHAEVRQARDAFELLLEKNALENAVTPPAFVKQNIIKELSLTPDAPVVNMPGADAKIKPLPQTRPVGFARMLAAASVILLVGSTLLNFYLYGKYKSFSNKLDEMIASTQQMAKENNIMQTKMNQYDNSFGMMKEVMRDSNMAVVAMKGQAVAPTGLTTIYWNKTTKDVYLMVNNLPAPAPGKQYQLWAIVDGVPVDAGMLDTNAPVAFVKMKNIPKAQAFAITLENTGGTQKPTMPIYVMGQI
ncbi:MAG: anti-sigma factor [Chitinophagaceae bacterium]